jgi:hypothetical protein
MPENEFLSNIDMDQLVSIELGWLPERFSEFRLDPSKTSLMLKIRPHDLVELLRRGVAVEELQVDCSVDAGQDSDFGVVAKALDDERNSISLPRILHLCPHFLKGLDIHDFAAEYNFTFLRDVCQQLDIDFRV